MIKQQIRDDDSSVAALVDSAEAGSAQAAKKLGDRYRLGLGIEQSNVDALDWYALAANLGDADAQNDLGTMLLDGVGCQADPAAAVRWYEASAEQGSAAAQFNLGLCYLHGNGVAQADRTAGAWMAKAVQQDYLPAFGEFGTMFRFGRGTEPDLLQAVQLYMAAAQDGDAKAYCNLAEVRGELIDQALDGDREAAFDLCRIYHCGLGVEKSEAWCWGWMRWAQACPSMPKEDTRMDDLDEEVAQALRFFEEIIDYDVREQGEALIDELLAERD